VDPKEVAEPAGAGLPARCTPTWRFWCGRALPVNDLVSQLDALVANEDAGPGNELADLVMALTAKVASLIHFGHVESIGL